jgi:hypothetical protein
MASWLRVCHARAPSWMARLRAQACTAGAAGGGANIQLSLLWQCTARDMLTARSPPLSPAAHARPWCLQTAHTFRDGTLTLLSLSTHAHCCFSDCRACPSPCPPLRRERSTAILQPFSTCVSVASAGGRETRVRALAGWLVRLCPSVVPLGGPACRSEPNRQRVRGAGAPDQLVSRNVWRVGQPNLMTTAATTTTNVFQGIMLDKQAI